MPVEDRSVAALLLTGGASRRMGRDKATLTAGDGLPLAVRTARLLAAVADPVIEVGPGHAAEHPAAEHPAAEHPAAEHPAADTRPPAPRPGPVAAVAAVADDWPGAGPLAAVATGVLALRRAGWAGPALVVATDLPGLDRALLCWLARHPYAGNVVPLVDGRPQLLCARYDAGTLARAPGLVEAGRRRMGDLIGGRPTHRPGPEEWAGVSASGSLRDIDTPEDLAGFAAGWGS